MIFNPQLPLKEGYIEIEIDGVRQYQKVISDTEQDAARFKDVLCEMDKTYDERIGAVEDALCDLDCSANGGETT
jgi:hypothetical protein